MGETKPCLSLHSFHFTSNQAYIRRDQKNGDVILSPSPCSLAEILAALGQMGVPEDFLAPPERDQSPAGAARAVTFTYLLDTIMVSYIAKDRFSVTRTQLLGLRDDEVACVSAVTEAEIRYRLAKRSEPRF